MLSIVFSTRVSTADDVRPEALISVPAGVVVEKDGLDMTLRAMRSAVRGGAEFQCFASPEWKIMAGLITDYRWFWEYSLRLEHVVELKNQEVKLLRKQGVIWQKALTVADEGRAFASRMVEEERKYRLKLDLKNRLRTRFLWVAVVAEAVVIAAIGITVVVKH